MVGNSACSRRQRQGKALQGLHGAYGGVRGAGMQGGKVDDISCVVAVVVEEDVPEPEESPAEPEDAGSEAGTAEADGAAAEPAG